MPNLDIFIQFRNEEEVSEFAKKIDPDLEADMVQKYKDAKAKGLICVFQLKDAPHVRAVVQAWRNR